MTVRVPAGAQPGRHPGAIVVEEAAPARTGAPVTLIAPGAARVCLGVPGPAAGSGPVAPALVRRAAIIGRAGLDRLVPAGLSPRAAGSEAVR